MSVDWKSKAAWLRIFLVLAICACILAGVWWRVHGYSKGIIPELIAWVGKLGGLGMAVFVVALVIICLSGVLPASIFAVAAGGIFGLSQGFLLSAFATLAAAMLAFLMSRYVLRDRFEKWISGHPLATQLDLQVVTSGWRLVFLLRLSPLAPFGLVSYAFGLSRVSVADYMLGTTASLPTLLALVYAGAITGKALLSAGDMPAGDDLFDWILMIAGFAATLVTAGYLTRLARRALKNVE